MAMIDEVAKHLEHLFAFAVKRTPTYEDAEDLSQDILTDLYGSLKTLKNRDSFTAWMWWVARYTYVNWLRKKQKAIY